MQALLSFNEHVAQGWTHKTHAPEDKVRGAGHLVQFVLLVQLRQGGKQPTHEPCNRYSPSWHMEQIELEQARQPGAQTAQFEGMIVLFSW